MKVSTQKSSSGIGLSLVTLLAILATLTTNVLSNFFPPQGLNIGQIANTILQEVQILPANYAFAIWGLIYVGLIAYGIHQLRPPQPDNPTIRQVNTLLIIACLAQIIWVYLFTLRLFWPSVLAMLVILLSLIGAYLKLNVRRDRAPSQHKWMVQVPFSLYLGWISVATIVNVASALYISRWDGWGITAQTWTAMMLVVGAVIAAIVAIQRADITFTAVFIWAYVAIALRQLNDPTIWLTAVAAAIILAVLLVFSSLRQRLNSAF